MAVQLSRWRFTVDDYHRMARAGILREDDRVELIEGEIVRMAPIGPPHFWSVGRLTELFTHRFSDVAFVVAQSPVRLDQHNEPQPDLLLLRRPGEQYRRALPTPQDVLLLIEVADTTLAYDRKVKMPLYARAGIPEAWLWDVKREVIHVFQDPSPDGYRTTRVLRRGDRVAPSAFPERTLDLDDLLG